MTGRRRVAGSSFAVSLGVHLALLAALAVLWTPPVQRTLDDLISVQLVPGSGDSPAGAPAAAPAGGPRARPTPPPPARPDGAQPRPPREAPAARNGAERRAEVAPDAAPAAPSAADADAGGPGMVGAETAFTAPAVPREAGAFGYGVEAIAGALQGLGRGDALSPGAGPGSVTAPGYRANPRPEYPPEAREQGFQGTAVLRVRVLPDGKPGEIVLERSSGHEILDGAAIRTVKAWLFVPATRNGVAVASWVTVPVRFTLAS